MLLLCYVEISERAVPVKCDGGLARLIDVIAGRHGDTWPEEHNASILCACFEAT